jgi:nucleoside-triphosphatase THEP1
MTTAMVLTAREQAKALKQQIQYRACLATAVHHRARNKVKANIRAEGKKVHHFSMREINELAEELLKQPGQREAMIRDCEGWVSGSTPFAMK